MENSKIYIISGVGFELNTDLDLDEAEDVQKFFGHTSLNNGSINLGNYKKEEVIRLYSIILKPKSGNLPENFSFSKIKESIQIEVIKDFFLSRIKKIISLQNSLSGSTGQP